MILFLLSSVSAMIAATVCIVMAVQDYSYGARRHDAIMRQARELQASRARRGVDIEDLLILCGAEGWSDGRNKDRVG
jgi:hypothetical protein